MKTNDPAPVGFYPRARCYSALVVLAILIVLVLVVVVVLILLVLLVLLIILVLLVLGVLLVLVNVTTGKHLSPARTHPQPCFL